MSELNIKPLRIPEVGSSNLLSSYFLHDLAIREAPCEGMGGLKRLKNQNLKSIKVTSETTSNAKLQEFYKNNNFGLGNVINNLKSSYPFLVETKDRYLDLTSLKKDKYYHKYFLFENEKSCNETKISLNDETGLTLSNSINSNLPEELKDEGQETSRKFAIPYVYIKKPKAPGIKPKSKCVFEIKPKNCSLEKIEKDDHGITLNKVLGAGRYAQDLLKVISPKRLDNKNHSIKSEDLMKTVDKATRKIEIADKKWKKRLIDVYSKKKLSDFYVENKINKPEDMASVFEHTVNWNLGNTLSQLNGRSYSKMNNLRMPVGVDFIKLNQQIEDKLNKNNKKSNNHKNCRSYDLEQLNSAKLKRNNNFNITNKIRRDSNEFNSVHENYLDDPNIELKSIDEIQNSPHTKAETLVYNSPEKEISQIRVDKLSKSRMDFQSMRGSLSQTNDIPKIERNTLYSKLKNMRKTQINIQDLASKYKDELTTKQLNSIGSTKINELFTKFKNSESLFKIRKKNAIKSNVKYMILAGKPEQIPKFIVTQYADRIKKKTRSNFNPTQSLSNNEKIDKYISKEYYYMSKKKVK